jgi:hypothetical protein
MKDRGGFFLATVARLLCLLFEYVNWLFSSYDLTFLSVLFSALACYLQKLPPK